MQNIFRVLTTKRTQGLIFELRRKLFRETLKPYGTHAKNMNNLMSRTLNGRKHLKILHQNELGTRTVDSEPPGVLHGGWGGVRLCHTL